MGKNYKCALAVIGTFFATQAAAEVVFYSGENFHGRSFTAERNLWNLEREGFNDRANSAIVYGGPWEVCEDAKFEGRCRVLRPGRYPHLAAMGMEHRISSVRLVAADARLDEGRYAPPPPYPVYDARRRPDERIFEAEVTSAKAVYGDAQQHCWVEREQVAGRGEPNVGGAIAGAVIGGILGHQVGSGRGNDAATAIGALAGGAVGANVGRDGGPGYTRDVQHCREHVSGPPQYWDVTYNFHGEVHHVQMAQPPGRTVMVNGRGEPRA